MVLVRKLELNIINFCIKFLSVFSFWCNRGYLKSKVENFFGKRSQNIEPVQMMKVFVIIGEKK